MKSPVKFTTLVCFPIVLAACVGGDGTGESGRTVPGESPAAIGTILGAVLPSERVLHVCLSEQTVFGGNPVDSDTALLRPMFFAAVEKEKVFVLDSGNNRVQVFDWNGEFASSFGRRGQGPGEFLSPLGLVLTNDRLMIFDAKNRRYSFWGLDGNHQEDLQIPTSLQPLLQLRGLSDGTVVGIARRGADAGSKARFVIRRDPSALKDLAVLAEFEKDGPPTGNDLGDRVYVPAASPLLAVGLDDTVFLATSGDYKVQAFHRDGRPRWSISVPWPRYPISDEEVLRAWNAIRGRGDLDRSRIPTNKPAISGLSVDGHGYLHVFLYPENRTDPQRMVDIYSPDGARVFTGWIAPVQWSFAVGDFVFQYFYDIDTGDESVVRYRLTLPSH